jgi:carbamoyltransferase
VNILGINYSGYHSSAALICESQIVAAAEEERFSRKKHDGSFPSRAIGYCLEKGAIKPEDVHFAAISWKPLLGIIHNLGHILRYFPGSFHLFAGREKTFMNLLTAKALLRRELGNPRLPVFYLEHHLCHAASTAFTSPFDSGAILSLDSSGEKTTTLLARFRESEIRRIGEVEFPHSLGLLYSAVSEHLGGYHHGGEGKVMGLAAYGKDAYGDLFHQMIRPTPNGFEMDLEYFEFHRFGPNKWLSRMTLDLLPPERPESAEILPKHMDLAASLQRRTEEISLHLANEVHKATGEPNLCMAGGVALNCSMNGHLLRQGPFADIHVQPAAHDAGTALGAALLIHHVKQGQPRAGQSFSPCLGPSFSDHEIEQALAARGAPFKRLESVTRPLARCLARGMIAGWFQGSMEFGPRALGNRSILADPRSLSLKDRLNTRIKKREFYRPYAPAVLWHRAADVLEMARPSPHMLFSFHVKRAWKERIPAVTHVDGTARAQTVTRENNPLFHDLIREFETITGVPALLNTSFNRRGEPIVCSPEDALTLFEESDLDILVMGNYMVEKGLCM